MTNNKDPILTRLNRAEGQIKAIKKMYDSGRSCFEIVQQIQAARSAMSKTAEMLLASEVKKCADKGDVRGLSEVLTRTFKTI